MTVRELAKQYIRRHSKSDQYVQNGAIAVFDTDDYYGLRANFYGQDAVERLADEMVKMGAHDEMWLEGKGRGIWPYAFLCPDCIQALEQFLNERGKQ